MDRGRMPQKTYRAASPVQLKSRIASILRKPSKQSRHSAALIGSGPRRIARPVLAATARGRKRVEAAAGGTRRRIVDAGKRVVKSVRGSVGSLGSMRARLR
eukprot:5607774-Pleurochrysis_carterae.AAC.1